MSRNRPLRRLSACLCAVVSTVAVSLSLASGASASTYTYCNGCTILGGAEYAQFAYFYLTLNYVHRLSGPYCTTIGARAWYADGTIGSYAYNQSCSDAVQHGYNGSKLGAGTATNFGAGNYGFNAHDDY